MADPIVPAYTASQVREAEQPLIAAGEPLMARAASALAQVVQELMADAAGRRVLVLAGSGNNGGDALFAAAEMLGEGASSRATIDILLTGTSTHDAGLAAAIAAGARVVDVAAASVTAYDLVIDGVLGTGTTGAPVLRGIARVAVAALLAAVVEGRTSVVAVDLPSGLHPDEGTTVDELVLPASVTVTFGGLKAGLVRERGPELAGRVVVVDIGLGERLAALEPVGEASVDRVISATDRGGV